MVCKEGDEDNGGTKFMTRGNERGTIHQSYLCGATKRHYFAAASYSCLISAMTREINAVAASGSRCQDIRDGWDLGSGLL